MNEITKNENVTSAAVEETYIDARTAYSDAGLCGGEDCSCGEPAGEEKLFTQRELDDLIRERLKRERKNNQALRNTKSLIDRLREEGIISADSYSGASREIARLFASRGAENAEEADAPRLEEEGTSEENVTCSADLLQEIASGAEGENTEEAFSGKEAEDITPEGSGNSLDDQLCRLFIKYPQAANDGILESRAFGEFCRAGGISALEGYERFRRLFDTLSSGESSTYEGSSVKRFSSTGFSKSSAGAVFDSEMSLSPTQRKIAREAGIPYREYASLLRDIPDVDYLKRNFK